MDLFEHSAREQSAKGAPLAERMRPGRIGEILGQDHLLGSKGPLRRWIEARRLPSLVFWGPPGTGKTTLARALAREMDSRFVAFSAVLAGVKEIREVVREAGDGRKFHGQSTILFVDEIHRFNKAQQDAFLPHVESGLITLIGATTENPSFEINSALLSRVKVLVLRPLSEADVTALLRRAAAAPEGLAGRPAEDAALAFIAGVAQGDARRALNLMEAAAAAIQPGDPITLDRVKESIKAQPLLYDKHGEEHYNLISAFIKSMRGSDPDAAVYWLARMLESGEDPRFIARRMIIFAAEDVSNADPRALQTAVSAFHAFEAVGEAEGWIPLSQAAVYLARAPKSNASYAAYKRAKTEIGETGPLPVPLHLRNAPTALMKDLGYGEGYKYPHDYEGHVVEQDYLPEGLRERRFYEPSGQGEESSLGKTK